jgi:hypothetical protein
MDLVTTDLALTKRAFCCLGEAPQLAEGDFTGVRVSRLAPPPVRQIFRGSSAAGRFHDPKYWGESVGTRPDAGIRGRKYLLGRKIKKFFGFGKAGT